MSDSCRYLRFGLSFGFAGLLQGIAVGAGHDVPENAAILTRKDRRHLHRSFLLKEPRGITQLLQLASAGDKCASDSLFSSVYQELRVIARGHRRRWHGNNTMNTTALIHEAYLKLAGGNIADYRSRSHFFATASKAMRQVLVNYAERMSTAKRGSDALRVTLSGHMPVTEDTLDDLLAMNEVLVRLEETNMRHCRLFECRVFGGLTIEETAAALNVSAATVKRDWALLSAWVYREMNAGPES